MIRITIHLDDAGPGSEPAGAGETYFVDDEGDHILEDSLEWHMEADACWQTSGGDFADCGLSLLIDRAREIADDRR